MKIIILCVAAIFFSLFVQEVEYVMQNSSWQGIVMSQGCPTGNKDAEYLYQ